jgi:predicted RNA-binding protein with TRAM domain
MAYSQYNKRRFEGEKPVTEGETYDLAVEATGAKGDGIGKVKGFVVIIPGAKPGNTVKVKIDAVRGKVAFGTLVGEAAAKAPSEEKDSGEEMKDSDASGENSSEEDSEEGASDDAVEDSDSEAAEESGEGASDDAVEDSDSEAAEESGEAESEDEEKE